MNIVRGWFFNVVSVGAVVAVVGASMAACGDDSSSSSGSGGTGSGSTTSSTTVSSGSTTTSSGTTGGSPGAGGAGGDSSGTMTNSGGGGSSGTGPTGPCTGSAEDIAYCKQQAAAQGTCPEVGDCGCDNCVCELRDCEDDAGCRSIRECAQRTGCTGFNCYSPSTCQREIDAAGGPLGPSTQIAQALSTCIENAGCPVQCP